MLQYCVYNQDPHLLEVAEWISQNNIKHEIHLNRTRFWVPQGPMLTEFLLKYSDICPQIQERLDNDYVLS